MNGSTKQAIRSWALIVCAALASCGDDGAGSDPGVAVDYVIRCAEFVERTCSIEIACAMRGEPTAFALTRSGSDVVFSDSTIHDSPARVSARGDVEATITDDRSTDGCRVTRTRDFVLAPDDPSAPARLRVALRHGDGCVNREDCAVELAGRLDLADEPQTPCGEASTEDPCDWVHCDDLGCMCPNIPGACDWNRPPP